MVEESTGRLKYKLPELMIKLAIYSELEDEK